MRHFILFIFSVLIFAGCAQKKVVVVDTQDKITKTEKEVEVIKEEVTLEDFSEILTTDSDFKVAVIFPSKVVGKYANSTINTVLGYLLYKNEKFEIETFDSVIQTEENIDLAFSQAIEKGYKNIIALYTQSSLESIYNVSGIEKTKVYFPIMHKEEYSYSPENFVFGSISYDAQMSELLKFSNGDNTTFYEDSSIGKKLQSKYDNLVSEIKIKKPVSRKNNSYKALVEDENLNDTTLMLNTPIIKTSIILSQLRAHDIKPTLILSTQINYDPILVTLTQFEDRVNFITASSIEPTTNNLEETLTMLGSDSLYNWVNYSSLIGINYLFSGNSDGLIKNKIIDNKVEYGVNLYNSTEYGFQKIESN